jgi:hypothetical protein
MTHPARTPTSPPGSRREGRYRLSRDGTAAHVAGRTATATGSGGPRWSGRWPRCMRRFRIVLLVRLEEAEDDVSVEAVPDHADCPGERLLGELVPEPTEPPIGDGRPPPTVEDDASVVSGGTAASASRWAEPGPLVTHMPSGLADLGPGIQTADSIESRRSCRKIHHARPSALVFPAAV